MLRKEITKKQSKKLQTPRPPQSERRRAQFFSNSGVIFTLSSRK